MNSLESFRLVIWTILTTVIVLLHYTVNDKVSIIAGSSDNFVAYNGNLTRDEVNEITDLVLSKGLDVREACKIVFSKRRGLGWN